MLDTIHNSQDTNFMPYILNNQRSIDKMFKEIGISSYDDLFKQIPDKFKDKKDLNIPEGLPESEVIKSLESLSDKNISLKQCNSFLGAGMYDHYIPSAVSAIVNRTEFYTSYTPYQPECSQGILQTIYEYQSYICMLTGMDVSNASLYDGAAAVAESALMSLRITRKEKVLLSTTVHPQYKDTLYTYFTGLDFSIEEIKQNNGLFDLKDLNDKVDDDTSCIIVQSPNFFGLIEDISKIKKQIADKNIIIIAVVNPMSLSLLKAPGDCGADIVCGDGQVFGNPIGFGGPSFGFLACKQKFMRQLPGRIVGKTVDSNGEDAYCLTLQTREQHIRREKATSNICSNQSLNAITAAVYLSLMGEYGFKQVGQACFNNTQYLYDCLSKISSVTIPFTNQVFNEFVWKIEGAQKLLKKLVKDKIIAGVYLGDFYPDMQDCILSACTEKKSKEDIDILVKKVEEYAK